MEDNKIDKLIKEKFENRNLQASPSAWERLENSLNESQENTKSGYNYKIIAVAASILLLLSVFIFQKSNNTEEIIPQKEILVEAPKETEIIEDKIEMIEDIEPLKVEEEKTMIASKEIKPIIRKKIKLVENTLPINTAKKDEVIIAKTKNKQVNPIVKDELPVFKKKKRIQVNSNDLLYAVTHSPEEVKTYYAKLKLNREDVLDTIKKQLRLSNLKVNPETILADVERSIENDEFKGDFMQKLKLKISDIALAIADRNK
ncbi:hypothetical protein WH52_01705 [Tenacibaculum holothuriorum]|uniref:Uncharacterized protein n=2 Tax=Tenacibaculum holothuriorum TaxID=1635173 RepID=A0A1Y2PI75_9FLAO|nr:hypothetical protein WH52_01705 [Tenacibaculum holothuriorum]